MKPNKVEISVLCFRMPCVSVRWIFGHGNSIDNIIPILKKKLQDSLTLACRPVKKKENSEFKHVQLH